LMIRKGEGGRWEPAQILFPGAENNLTLILSIRKKGRSTLKPEKRRGQAAFTPGRPREKEKRTGGEKELTRPLWSGGFTGGGKGKK